MFFKSFSSAYTSLIISLQKSLFMESCIFENDSLHYPKEISDIIRITICKQNLKKIFNGDSKYMNQTKFEEEIYSWLISITDSTFSRSSHPEVILVKGVLKICSRFTGDHPCRSVISINFQSNFIELKLWHGCSPLNLLHIFRTPLGVCFWFSHFQNIFLQTLNSLKPVKGNIFRFNHNFFMTKSPEKNKCGKT